MSAGTAPVPACRGGSGSGSVRGRGRREREEGGRVPARCEAAACAADDELLAPLTEDERARLTDLVRRIAGTEAEV
ncbi:hypothetical protein [Streptomyces violaceorubidus]|uniref:hypothetical protein n=1 Tax=Streptomyces violaceorubidus TaxID=284042 RepID=UPI000689E75E|nr:hypothetical protein [Streptomyces violaceorubidus]